LLFQGRNIEDLSLYVKNKNSQYLALLSYSVPGSVVLYTRGGGHMSFGIGIFGFCISFDQNRTDISIEFHGRFMKFIINSCHRHARQAGDFLILYHNISGSWIFSIY
jgi:hypothetical protein